MSKPVCRIGDIVTGVCEANSPGHPRNFTGVWITGSDTTYADGISIIRIGDTGITDCNHTFHAITGSDILNNENIPVVRVGDIVQVIEGGIGVAITGSDTVFDE